MFWVPSAMAQKINVNPKEQETFPSSEGPPSEEGFQTEGTPLQLEAVPPEERAIFLQAKTFFEQGNHEISRASLEDFLLHYPESLILADAYLLLSDVYIERNEFNRATELMEIFLDLFPEENRIKRVQHRLTEIYFNLGHFKKVLNLWDEITSDDDSKLSIYERLTTNFLSRDEILKALHVMLKKRDLRSDLVNTALVEQDIIALIEARLDEEALQSVVAEFGADFPADKAMIHLIKLYDRKEDYYHEEQEAIRFLDRFPSDNFASQVRQMLAQIKWKIKKSRYLIAVILPLSGKLAVFGQNALYGVELALQIFKESLPGASVGLVVRDSVGDPSRLRLTLKEWLDEYEPIAIVGPLLSKEVNRVAQISLKADLPLISPGATARRLLSLGNTVFRNAVTNRYLCHAIAEYAVLQLEVERFAVFYPDGQQGHLWVDCFSKGVEKLGAEVVVTEQYPLDNTDFSRSILRLKRADLEQEGFIDDVENEDGEIEPLYTPGFEAIFLPADAVRAGLIIPQLLFHEYDEVNVIGTNSWNSPEFLKLTEPYAEGVIFVDGFFKESSDPVVKTFVKAYRNRFHQEPDLFSAQSYDAMRLIFSAMRKGALTPSAIKTAIGETIDFPGASGFIYEVLNGEFVKEPFYIGVEDGKFVQVN